MVRERFNNSLIILEFTRICLEDNRLRVVPHFSSGIVDRAKRERA